MRDFKICTWIYFYLEFYIKYVLENRFMYCVALDNSTICARDIGLIDLYSSIDLFLVLIL